MALRTGGNMACIMNAANEVVVEAFLENHVRFLDMPGIIEKTMSNIHFIPEPTLTDYAETDLEARAFAGRVLSRM